jgi:purine-binding chemotaxis protein CheW
MAGTQLMTTTDTVHHTVPVQYVTMRVGDALVGISVHCVQDVIRYQPITAVPLTQAAVAGALNVRGRIVTAIDMRKRLGLGDYPSLTTTMMVVVEYQHELFALMADAVGDVLSLMQEDQERLPANMDDYWRSVALGVYKLDADLLVIIDVASVIDHLTKGHAA